ncbi:MAG: phosphotransferase [Actinobacteria bacterium]|nr:MAG: phosphotransferase [Actinomycetota bacterium]
MRSQPARLAEADLVAALERGWDIPATAVSYFAVGAGSHHWRVEDRHHQAWFVTVDDLDGRRSGPRESRADVFDRLVAALATAHALKADGADYVVAPIAERTGGVLHRLGDEWALAVYPMIDGETFRGGQALPVADRLAVVDVIARLHTASLPTPLHARSDDYQLQNRADLEAAIADPDGHADAGPYSRPLAGLLAEHRQLIVDMLAEYDDLAGAARAHNDRTVLTHGEPHAGNSVRTPSGWMLVDWDTALLAAPERDMWLLEPGDGLASAAYAAATGVEVLPDRLALFRLRWDLADLGVDLARLCAPHANNADDARSWDGISHVLTRRRSGDAVPRAAWR